MRKLVTALEEIRYNAEAHPCFAGYDSQGLEGGDIAFVTTDIAKVANDALVDFAHESLS